MTAKEITPVAEAAANRQGCYVVDITVSRDNDITVVLDKETGTVGMEDCIAVNDAVLLSGKGIVYSKTEEGSFNSSYLECIDSDCIVLATHQYGLPCNIEAIAA